MNTLHMLEYNEVLSVLSEAARKELTNFRGRSSYQKYRSNPAMVIDDGADNPINVLTKILLDKNERLKEGRDILYEPKFTQVGIAHGVFDEEDMVILIFAIKFIDDEPDFELPKGDLH